MWVRKAHFEDVEEIYALVNEYAAKRIMLPVTRVRLYETLRAFFVVEDEMREEGGGGRNSPSGIYGCAALLLSWGNTAEVRSVAVQPNSKKRGVGTKLVEACLNEAVELGLGKVFLLTYEPNFFARFGFRIVDKETLPQKVWTDCVNCPHYPDCDETAMILELEEYGAK